MSSAAPGKAERPTEVVDWLDRWLYHPPARWIALALKPTGISPNAVSVGSALLLIAAAFAYTGPSWPESVLLGFLLQFLAGVLDGTDGDLARMTGKTSPTGELVDGVCDYIGQVALYIALTLFLADQIGPWAWAIASAAGASHIVQMNHAESQRRFYLWWAHHVPWLKNAQAAGDEVFRKENWFSVGFGWMARDYIRLSQAMTPYATRVDALVDAAGTDAVALARIGGLARDRLRRTLAFQKMLTANPRWLLVGLSMALGSPLWYFLAEITAMNLLLFASLREHNRSTRQLAEAIERSRGDG